LALRELPNPPSACPNHIRNEEVGTSGEFESSRAQPPWCLDHSGVQRFGISQAALLDEFPESMKDILLGQRGSM
jgi:hypothetical protein